MAELTYLTMMSFKQHTTIACNISSILYQAFPSVLAKIFAMWKTSIYMQQQFQSDVWCGDQIIESLLYTFQSWYFINNKLPIWHNVPSNLASHSQLISPYSPIEQFPPFLHIFTPPGEHLSNSNFNNSINCIKCNKFQNDWKMYLIYIFMVFSNLYINFTIFTINSVMWWRTCTANPITIV